MAKRLLRTGKHVTTSLAIIPGVPPLLGRTSSAILGDDATVVAGARGRGEGRGEGAQRAFFNVLGAVRFDGLGDGTSGLARHRRVEGEMTWFVDSDD